MKKGKNITPDLLDAIAPPPEAIEPEQECLREVSALLQKHGMRIISTVNHYQHLLMKEEFEKDRSLVLQNEIRIVKNV